MNYVHIHIVRANATAQQRTSIYIVPYTSRISSKTKTKVIKSPVRTQVPPKSNATKNLQILVIIPVKQRVHFVRHRYSGY